MPGPGSQVGGAEFGCELRGEPSDLLQVAHQVVLNPEVILGMRKSHGATVTAEGQARGEHARVTA